MKKFDFIEKNNFPSGKRIKKLMAETGTNYSDLMDGGFSAVEVGFYRMGKLEPSLEEAEKIINICGAGDEITAEELISREDEPPIMTLQGLDKRLTRERKLLNKGLKYLEQAEKESDPERAKDLRTVAKNYLDEHRKTSEKTSEFIKRLV